MEEKKGTKFEIILFIMIKSKNYKSTSIVKVFDFLSFEEVPDEKEFFFDSIQCAAIFCSYLFGI
jgi:hypothetical protein